MNLPKPVGPLLAGFLTMAGAAMVGFAAVAAGTASTLELGAGRYEPREAGQLIARVEVVELERVAS